MTVENIDFNKKIALKLHSAKVKFDTRIHELSYLFWECTLRCNLSCVHCGSDCSKDSDIEDMPKEHFLEILDQIEPFVNKEKIIVAISGGEPLMRPDLIDACRKISEKGFRWGMVTNGFALTKEKLIQLVDAGLQSIAISVDGLEKEHNWFRGNNNSFKNAINAIGYLSEMSIKTGLVFDVVTCVNKRNFKDLERIKKLLIDLGVKRWRLGTVFPKGRAAENNDLKITGEQLENVLLFIEKERATGEIVPSYGCESFLGAYEMRVRDLPFYCKAGISVGSVLADGSISACPSLRGDYVQGNIYKDNFLDVWENKFDVMRNRAWTKVGECKCCKVWKYCKGNSLHLRDENSGELLYCSYNEIKSCS